MKLINEEYWNHWEAKRIERNDGRPPMPKELPHVCNNQVIFNPPWIWNSSKERYTPNFGSFSKFLASGKPREYDGTI